MKKNKIILLTIFMSLLLSINVHAAIEIEEKNTQYFNQKISNLNEGKLWNYLIIM